MDKQKPPFKISHEYEVVPLGKEKAYLITISDWDYLKTKISRIKSTTLTFHTIGSVLLGVAATAGLSARTLPAAVKQVEPFIIPTYWAISAVTLICGLLCIFFTHLQRKGVTSSKDDVLEELGHLQKKFTADEYRSFRFK